MKALEMDDSNIYAYLGLANIIGEHGMVQDAIQLYKVALEIAPKVP